MPIISIGGHRVGRHDLDGDEVGADVGDQRAVGLDQAGRVGDDRVAGEDLGPVHLVGLEPELGRVGRLEAAGGAQAAHGRQRLPGLVGAVGEDGPAGGEHPVLLADLGRRLAVRLDDLGDGVGRVLHAGDEAVGVGARERGRLGAARRHQDGQGTLGRGVELRGLGGVVLAVEGHLLARQQAVHDLQRFLHPRLALAVAGEREAERALVEGLAGADAEPQAAVGEPVDGRGHLRDQRRVVVEQRAGDGGAEQHVLVLTATAPSQDQTKPAADVSSTHGWKWSLPSTASNPASSAATACSTRSSGW